jgi:hypothetical protein
MYNLGKQREVTACLIDPNRLIELRLPAKSACEVWVLAESRRPLTETDYHDDGSAAATAKCLEDNVSKTKREVT